MPWFYARHIACSGSRSNFSTYQRFAGPRTTTKFVERERSLYVRFTTIAREPPGFGASPATSYRSWRRHFIMISSRFSNSSRLIASRAGPLALPHTPPRAWRSCCFAAAMKARIAPRASAPPVTLPLVGVAAVDTITGGDVRHALNSIAAMISFFTRSSGSSQLATYSMEFNRGSGNGGGVGPT